MHLCFEYFKAWTWELSPPSYANGSIEHDSKSINLNGNWSKWGKTTILHLCFTFRHSFKLLFETSISNSPSYCLTRAFKTFSLDKAMRHNCTGSTVTNGP